MTQQGKLQGSSRFYKLVKLALVSVLSFAIAGSFCTPTEANVLTSRVLRKGLEFLAHWGAGKIVDRALGLDCQQELERIESSLEREIRSSGDSRQETAAELRAVQSMLAALQEVMNSQPTVAAVEELKRRVTVDIQHMLDIQRNHESRLRQLEEAQSVDQATDEEILARLKALEEEALLKRTAGVVSRSQSSLGESGRREWEPPLPHKSSPPRTGVTLNLLIKGAENQLLILEARKGGEADIGEFEIKGEGTRFTYRLSWGTGAVVTVTGINNMICIQKQAKARVRILNHGEGTRVNRNCRLPPDRRDSWP